jgi:uncharacterized protein YndB with AHSA1/START domain
MNDTTITKDMAARTVKLERVFNASRDRVWQAFTDGDILAKWWGPNGWQTTTKEFNFTVGGHWVYVMKCLDENQGEFFGQESCGKSTYTDISQPDSFSYKDEFCDSDGNVDSTMPTMNITVEFVEQADGKTLVRSIGVLDSEAGFKQVVEMGMEEGIRQTWQRLAEMLEA